MNKEEFKEEIFECKLYITDLETNKNSKEINITDLIFDDNLEFEFGNYEDEDYGQLPYKDFKFFINDYSVTFYSPQYHNAIKEIDRLNNIINQLEKESYLGMIENQNNNDYSKGLYCAYEYINKKIKELKEGNNETKKEC